MDPTRTDTLGWDSGRLAPAAASMRAYLFLVIECDRPRAPPLRFVLDGLHLVKIGRGPSRTTKRFEESGAPSIGLELPDRCASGTHARLVRLVDRWLIEDSGSKNGTILNGALTMRGSIADGDVIQIGRTFFVYREVSAADAPATKREVAAKTVCPELELVFSELERVSESQVSVLVRGETGTGKELAARAIHARSGRSGDFIAVNCGALPATLVESALFGHKKGSFSGALDDAPGFVRAAHGGTLFLDEIGDLPLESQAAFLRVLQEREVVPVGATKAVPVDFRLVSATHRDLGELVREGKFRSDLFARIAGHEVLLPPLRARREDLGLLIASSLAKIAPDRAERITFESDAIAAMLAHDWPLNVRELEQALASAIALAGGEDRIGLPHLSEALRASLLRSLELARAADPEHAAPTDKDLSIVPMADPEPVEAAAAPKRKRKLTDVDRETREALIAHLKAEGGNISAVARVMGKKRTQIQRWIKRYAIKLEEFN